MISLPQITFPKIEWDDIKTRLSEDKIVYTIRVSGEYDKYYEGDILMTEWGTKVKILSVKKITGGIKELKNEYQHFDQLTDEMIKELEPFQAMEIISMKMVVL
jgi:hypothetical protein